MDDADIRKQVAKLEAARVSDEEAAWLMLKPLGPRVLPYFLEAFPNMKRWRGRVSIVFHSIKYARTHEEAFALGVLALGDKSVVVRYRGCMLLACSLRQDAVPYLKELLHHEDRETVDNAKAALDAINRRNHNFFVDRDHSGKMFLHYDGYAP